MGLRIGSRARGSRVPRARDDELRARLHAGSSRWERDARRDGGTCRRARSRDTAPRLGGPRERLRRRTGAGRHRDPACRGSRRRRWVDRGLRPRRAPPVSPGPRDRADRRGGGGGSRTPVPVHTHGAGREPHPRESRHAGHDPPAAVVRGSRRRRSLRPRSRDHRRRPDDLRIGREAGERAGPTGDAPRRARRRRCAPRERRRRAHLDGREGVRRRSDRHPRRRSLLGPGIRVPLADWFGG